MIQIKKTPMDIIEDIYNLAWWMTGSEKASEELVNCTYLNASIEDSETEIIRSFRECYLGTYGQNAELHVREGGNAVRSLVESLREWAADVRLSVLLNELTGLEHRQIAEVIGKPVETIRLWLYWGRKFLAGDELVKASA